MYRLRDVRVSRNEEGFGGRVASLVSTLVSSSPPTRVRMKSKHDTLQRDRWTAHTCEAPTAAYARRSTWRPGPHARPGGAQAAPSTKPVAQSLLARIRIHVIRIHGPVVVAVIILFLTTVVLVTLRALHAARCATLHATRCAALRAAHRTTLRATLRTARRALRARARVSARERA
jgi:hypothetical protein